VDSILSRRPTLQGFEERCQYALDLVQLHLEEENPERIDECLRLYAFNAVWQAPARNVSYSGLRSIKANYLRIFRNVEDFRFEHLERFATPERVFVDSRVRFRITGDAFDNCPLPVGSRAEVRLLHTFHIADGLISREIDYEIWQNENA
jgi:hypothetical protein